MECRSDTSPTGCTSRPGWAPRCGSCSIRYLGADWLEQAADAETWAAVDAIPDEELWAVRERQRAELVSFISRRSVTDRLARGDVREYVRGRLSRGLIRTR